MPKKTREQKIIAEYRRKLKKTENKSSTTNANASKANSHIYSKPSLMSNPEISSKKIEEDLQTRKLFLSDVRKSLILISVIIALEISLYFVNIIGNLEKIL